MQRAEIGGLRALHEVLGVDHRPDLQPTVAVGDLDAIAATVGQLAGDATDVCTDDVRGAIEPLRLVALGRNLHEVAPDRDRQFPRISIADDRRRLIESEPYASHEMWCEPDEPRIVVIVGRSGFPRRWQRESRLSGTISGAGIDDVG